MDSNDKTEKRRKDSVYSSRSTQTTEEEFKPIAEAQNPHKKSSYEERQAALAKISLEPIACPVTSCGLHHSVSDLLRHALQFDHAYQPFCKAYAGVPTLFSSKLSVFDLSEIKCLGVIGYTGTTKESLHNLDLQPGRRLICLPNLRLMGGNSNLRFVMPIFLMASRTTWPLMLLPKKKLKYCDAHLQQEQQIFVIWLLGAPCLKALHGTVSVFDFERKASVSSILEIHQFSPTFDLKDVVAEGNHRIILNYGDMSTFTNEGNEHMLIEVILHENE